MPRKSRKYAACTLHQDTDAILRLFGEKVSDARRQHHAFVEKGIEIGIREDLIGGGLIRSHGGWANVKAMRRAKIFEKADERILGDGGFVKNVITAAEEKMKADLPSGKKSKS
jgi:putative transposase